MGSNPIFPKREESMDFCFDCYKYDRTENQWEKIAKKNNPNFNIPKRFFAIRNIEAILNCVYPANLIPIDTEEGHRVYSGETLIPFELYNVWIETHPNQRIFNDFSLKCALEQGLLSKEFFNELQEKGLIIEPPEELKEKCL